jgi:hypothetical protein
MAVISSISFTPVTAGRVQLSISCNISTTLGDSGGYTRSTCFWQQDGVTTLGNFVYSPSTGAKETLQMSFNVAAGVAVSAGLWGEISGARASSWTYVFVSYILLKK